MSEDTSNPLSPLDAFLEAFIADVEAGAVRPLVEYLARFPGDDAAIAEAWIADARGAWVPPSADHIAHYRIVRQIGRGAQGTVYLAEDTHLHRQVALKVMDPGFAVHRIAVERFRREAEITSRLDHAGICTVYETGEDRGVLWIAMRYVEGDSLAQKVSTARECLASGSTSTFDVLSEHEDHEAAPTPRPPPSDNTGPKTWADISRLLALFEETARALHVAHEAGVIHRDIKPGNIIVTRDGHPVILDFGLAHEVDGDHPTLTLSGDIMGTPAYMSPEQIAAHRIRLDRRTDVYSLGVSLYECLTLKRPFDAPTREGLYHAIMTKSALDPRQLNPALPRDLKVVIEAALEKDRDRRYQTSLDFAEDLRRVRVHEPIRAKPVGPWGRAVRVARRNPLPAALGSGLLIALIAWATTATLQRVKIQRALIDEGLASQKAESRATEAREALAREREAVVAAVAARDLALGFRLVSESNLARARDGELALVLAVEGARRAPGPAADDALLAALGNWRPRVRLGAPDEDVLRVTLSPDGRFAAGVTADAAYIVWATASGKPAFSVPTIPGEIRSDEKRRRLRTAGVMPAPVFDPGSRLVCVHVKGAWKVHDAATGDRIGSIAGPPQAELVFSIDGKTLLLVRAGKDGSFEAFDVATQQKGLRVAVPFLVRARWADGSRRIVVYAAEERRDGEISSIAAANGKVVSRVSVPRKWMENHFEVAPDGKLAAVCSTGYGGAPARIFSVIEGREVASTDGRVGSASDVAFSDDGSTLLTVPSVFDSRRSRTFMPRSAACLWNPTTGALLGRFCDEEATIMVARMHQDAARVTAVTDAGTIWTWDRASGKLLQRLPGDGVPIVDAAVSSDGSVVLTHSSARGASVRRTATVALPVESSKVTDCAPDPILGRAAIGSASGGMLTDPVGSKTTRLEANGRTGCFSWARNGEIVAGCEGKRVAVWRASDGARLRSFDRDSGWQDGVTLSPRGDVLAVADPLGCTLLDPITGTTHARLTFESEPIIVRFSEDGGAVLIQTIRGDVGIYHSATGAVLQSPRSSKLGFLWHVDARLETALVGPSFHTEREHRFGGSGPVGLIPLRDGVATPTLESPDAQSGFDGVGFDAGDRSTDGKTAIACTINGQLVVWDAAKGGPPRRVIKVGDRRLTACRIDPGGSIAVTADDYGGMTCLDLATGAVRFTRLLSFTGRPQITFAPRLRCVIIQAGEGVAFIPTDPLGYALDLPLRPLSSAERASFGLVDDAPASR